MEDSIMSLQERKERLTKLARKDTFTRQFHAASVIEAIDTLCKIDGIYKQQVEVIGEVIHSFVFVLPDGTKFIPGLPSKAAPTQLPEHATTIETEPETT